MVQLDLGLNLNIGGGTLIEKLNLHDAEPCFDQVGEQAVVPRLR